MATTNLSTAADVLSRNGSRSYNGRAKPTNDPLDDTGHLNIRYQVHGQKGVGGRCGVFIANADTTTTAPGTLGATGWNYLGEAVMEGKATGGASPGIQTVAIPVTDALVTALNAEAQANLVVCLVPRDSTEYHWGFNINYENE